MSNAKKPAGRKPATKFPHLQKKMDKSKLRAAMKTNAMHVRKSGNR